MNQNRGIWAVIALIAILLLWAAVGDETVQPTLDAPETWADQERHLQQIQEMDEYFTRQKHSEDTRQLKEEHAATTYEEVRKNQEELEEWQAEQAKNITPLGTAANPPGP